MVVEGCWTNTSCVAAPGFTTTFEEVTDVSPVAEKTMVMVFAVLKDRFRNVAVPFDAVAVKVPCNVPVPALRAAVTTVLLSALPFAAVRWLLN